MATLVDAPVIERNYSVANNTQPDSRGLVPRTYGFLGR